jgi:putative FmdB family regulatory protein
MPTYEYACKSCGEHLEVVQSFKDDPLTECPKCGGQLRKVFGSIGVTFRGSGFYRTDSRAPARRESKGSDKGADKTAENGADTAKGDTKASSGESKGGTSNTAGKGEAKSA